MLRNLWSVFYLRGINYHLRIFLENVTSKIIVPLEIIPILWKCYYKAAFKRLYQRAFLPSILVNPLTVATGKKSRLVIDLRQINSFIYKHSLRSGGSDDPGFRSLTSELQDRHGGWKNSKSKFRYIDPSSTELVGITHVMHI